MRKHNRCRGIRLWKWGRFQIELWFVPEGEFIEPHKHDQIDSSIMLIFGLFHGTIDGRNGFPRKFKRYPVPAGIVHSAHAYTSSMFINFERWKTNTVTSAATDFTAV